MLRQRQTGFTLIEIMIAVAILSIIAAIAIPAYRGYIQESRYGAALQDMRQMQLILDDLALDNELDDVDGGTDPQGIYIADNGAIAFGDPPTDPSKRDPWGNMYIYDRDNSATNPQQYTLESYGPDGLASGDDNVSPN